MGNLETVKAYEACWDTCDADGMLQHFAPGGTYTYPGKNVATGQAIVDYAQAVFKAFPDTKMPLTNTFSEGERVCTEWVYSATMTGDFGDIPATGKFFSLAGAHVFEMEGGKIKSVASRWDQVELLTELGLMG